ncbi:MAG: alpha/beta hydrolase family protein [Halapricum sp.]
MGDFTALDAGDDPLVAAFFGSNAGEGAFEKRSPVAHVDPEDPPVMLGYDIDDSSVPYRSTTGLAAARRDTAVPVEVSTDARAGHGMSNSPEWRERTVPRQIDFLDEHR